MNPIAIEPILSIDQFQGRNPIRPIVNEDTNQRNIEIKKHQYDSCAYENFFLAGNSSSKISLLFFTTYNS